MRRLVLGGVLLSLACPTSATRDAVTAEVGTACTTESAGACESPTRLITCQNQKWVVVSDCKGPDGCQLVGDSYDCDLRGNSVGDLCPSTSEDKVRCDPDGGTSILRCVGGTLTSIYACPNTTVCQFIDGGLTCG